MHLDEETDIWFDQGVQTIYSFVDARRHCSYEVQAILESAPKKNQEERWLVIEIVMNERCRLLRESQDGFIRIVEDSKAPKCSEIFGEDLRLYTQLDQSRKRVRGMMTYFEVHPVGKEFLIERVASSATFLAELAMENKYTELAIVVTVDVVTSSIVKDDGNSRRASVKALEGKAVEASTGKKAEERKSDDAICVICHEELWGPAVARSLPCFHRFHGECMMQWLAESHRCPFCRFEIPLRHIPRS